MSRMWRPPEKDMRKKGPDPIWRGVGCLLFIFLTFGCYLFTAWLIPVINASNEAEPFLPGPLRNGIPQEEWELYTYTFPRPVTELGPIKLEQPITRWPIRIEFVSIALTLFFSVLAFSLITLVWAFMNPPKLGPKDAPPVRRKIDPTKVR